MNNLLNLAYELLRWKVHVALIKSKLEPYLGFLHSFEFGKPSLVCDFQELYRYLIDDFVIQYSRKLRPKDFVLKDEYYSINKKGKRQYLKEDKNREFIKRLNLYLGDILCWLQNQFQEDMRAKRLNHVYKRVIIFELKILLYSDGESKNEETRRFAYLGLDSRFVIDWGLLGGFFQAFGDDLYQSAKTWAISRFGTPELTNATLREQTIILYKDIMEFLRQREANEPQIDFDKWEESIENSTRYSQETMNLYHENFGPRVVQIREEYLKRGITNEKVEMFYTHPTNPLGIHELAYGLAELASKIEV